MIIPNRYDSPSIENVPLWEKFENNTIDKEKILFLLVFIKIFSLSTPGLLGIPIAPEKKKWKKSKNNKSPERKTAYKKFLLYCEELELTFSLEECFLKWIQKMPTDGFKEGNILEFVEWEEKSSIKKGWHSALQERLYIGMNLYLLKKKNVKD